MKKHWKRDTCLCCTACSTSIFGPKIARRKADITCKNCLRILKAKEGK